MTDIDGLLRQAGVSALKSLLRKAVDSYRFSAMEAELRPVMPVRAAVDLLNALTPGEISGLESYLESPDFEQVMLHVMVGMSRPKRETDDGFVREELRHGLRLHVGLSEENGYALTGTGDGGDHRRHRPQRGAAGGPSLRAWRTSTPSTLRP